MESMRGDLSTKPLLFLKFVEHVCVVEVDRNEAIFYVFCSLPCNIRDMLSNASTCISQAHERIVKTLSYNMWSSQYIWFCFKNILRLVLLSFYVKWTNIVNWCIWPHVWKPQDWHLWQVFVSLGMREKLTLTRNNGFQWPMLPFLEKQKCSNHIKDANRHG